MVPKQAVLCLDRVYLGIIAMKMYSTLHIYQKFVSYHQIQFIVMLWTTPFGEHGRLCGHLNKIVSSTWMRHRTRLLYPLQMVRLRRVRSVKYPSIAITPRFTLTQSDNTCLVLIYRSNRSLWKLFDRNTSYDIAEKILYIE